VPNQNYYQEGVLTCYEDSVTGLKYIWSRPIQNGLPVLFAPFPENDSALIVINSDYAALYDIRTGDLYWELPKVTTKYTNAVVSTTFIYLVNNERIMEVININGKKLFSFSVLNETANIPMIYYSIEDWVIVPQGNGGISAYTGGEGKLKWNYPANESYPVIIQSISLNSGILFVIEGNGQFNIPNSLIAFNASTGSVLWKYEPHDVYHEYQIATDTLLLDLVTNIASGGTGTSSLYALNPNIGDVIWNFGPLNVTHFNNGKQINYLPSSSGDYIYVSMEINNNVYVILQLSLPQ